MQNIHSNTEWSEFSCLLTDIHLHLRASIMRHFYPHKYVESPLHRLVDIPRSVCHFNSSGEFFNSWSIFTDLCWFYQNCEISYLFCYTECNAAVFITLSGIVSVKFGLSLISSFLSCNVLLSSSTLFRRLLHHYKPSLSVTCHMCSRLVCQFVDITIFSILLPLI